MKYLFCDLIYLPQDPFQFVKWSGMVINFFIAFSLLSSTVWNHPPLSRAVLVCGKAISHRKPSGMAYMTFSDFIFSQKPCRRQNMKKWLVKIVTMNGYSNFNTVSWWFSLTAIIMCSKFSVFILVNGFPECGLFFVDS